MKAFPGKHRPPLPTPVDRWIFQDIVQLVEAQKNPEPKIQAKINRLSASYYYVSCDIEAYKIRKGILILEREKYRLQSETNVYLLEMTSRHH